MISSTFAAVFFASSAADFSSDESRQENDQKMS